MRVILWSRIVAPTPAEEDTMALEKRTTRKVARGAAGAGLEANSGIYLRRQRRKHQPD